MNRAGALVVVLVGACGPARTTVVGRATVSRLSDEPLAGADLELRGEDNGLYGLTTTADDGTFELTSPRESQIYLVLAKEGYVTLSFPGASGIADTFEVPDGQIWGLSDAEAATWRADFEGCPGDPDVGMIVGEVRVALPSASYPIDINGFAFVEGDGERTEACYLGDGGAYDPAATTVGPTGRFAIFGRAGGPLRLGVGRDLGDTSLLSEWKLYVPEGGATSLHPALVNL